MIPVAWTLSAWKLILKAMRFELLGNSLQPEDFQKVCSSVGALYRKSVGGVAALAVQCSDCSLQKSSTNNSGGEAAGV